VRGSVKELGSAWKAHAAWEWHDPGASAFSGGKVGMMARLPQARHAVFSTSV